MYVPACSGLYPGYFFRSPSPKELPFPLNAPRRTYFYRARNAIYHLFRALRFQQHETVLVPDYHSGNEVWAIRAAGATIRYFTIGRNLEPDLAELERLCRYHSPRALFVIHYLGWPQPMKEIMALCREREMMLIEDCALALCSEVDGQPLGTFGDYSIFCLYKTLPVPNGGLLVQNRNVLDELNRLELLPCDIASVGGRSAELVLEWIRSCSDGLGNALCLLKTGIGKTLSPLRLRRLPVGDIGFDIGSVNTAMSSLTSRLLKLLDYKGIRQRRRENFLLLYQKLADRATLLREDLEEGVCPLFFPILVPDKHSAARTLWQRGIAAVEFWNFGDSEARGKEFSEAQFLRKHVLELPIHQDVTPEQIQYIADQVLSLRLHF